jgi:DNA ligase 1
MDFIKLAQLLEQIEQTSKRIEKTHMIAQFLLDAPASMHYDILLLLQGRVFPFAQRHKLSVSAQTTLKALQRATGISLPNIEEVWKKTGDLGDTAQQIIAKKKQVTLVSSSLTVQDSIHTLQQLVMQTGQDSVNKKIGLIAKLYGDAQPLEAKYITRIILETMRIGAQESTLKDALIWAYFPQLVELLFEKKLQHTQSSSITITSLEQLKNIQSTDYISITTTNNFARTLYNYCTQAIQYAYDITHDFAVVGAYMQQRGIAKLYSYPIEIGTPLKAMLPQKEPSLASTFDRLGAPLACEYKYDGFRVQIHKKNETVTLFTRNLEDVTTQFPDIVQAVKHIQHNCILDTEVMGIAKDGSYLSFQHISQRIQRKHDIATLVKKIPITILVFDILYYKNESTISMPFTKRRELLESFIVQPLRLSTIQICNTVQEAQLFFEQSLRIGNEGIMIKSLDAQYQPGSRVGTMIKMKEIMETLDLVITEAYWGEGKRSAWLTSFTVCCINESGEYIPLGNVSTGLKELDEQGTSFNYMTELLQPLIVHEKGTRVQVKPEVIIEVGYEEIQKSTNYASGYALRFPRFLRLREKGVDEVSSITLVRQLYDEQRNNTRKIG